MELRQLEYFLAVVETGSFTGAAAQLYMVQSSLSASVLSLERELGTELFIRSRRGAELTDAGRAFVDPARATIRELRRAQEAVDEIRGLLRGSVRLATVAVPRRIDPVVTMREFRAAHPGVDLYVVEDGAQDLAGLVADSRVDFAITPLARQMAPAVQFEPLLHTPLVAVCRTDHALAGARDVDPGRVLDEEVIDLPRGWWVRELFDGLLAQRGLRRQVHIEVNEWFGVLAMVRQGLGVTYGPLACLDQDAVPDLAWATLAGAPSWDLGIVTRDDTLLGAAGRAFLAVYRERCRAALAGGTGGPPPPAHGGRRAVD